MNVDDFVAGLHRWSAELYADNQNMMSTGDLLPTKNVIDPTDVALFGRGIDAGLIAIERGGRFNTADRPLPGGRWALLSRSREGGWYNAEYLPQIVAYVSAVLDSGFDRQRVLFELPASALQLDLAVVDDDGLVVVLGEAKRDTAMLTRLNAEVHQRFESSAPTDDSKKRGDEVRQLAWRLWTTGAPYLWLIGPGQRVAFACTYEPLVLEECEFPRADEIGLGHAPAVAPIPDVHGRAR